MTTVRTTVNKAALTAFLHSDPGMQAALKAKADEMKGVVDDLAQGFRNTGHYAARTYVRKFRFGYQVVNGDTFSFMVEYGTVNNPTYAPMRTAAHQLFGEHFSEKPKQEDDDG